MKITVTGLRNLGPDKWLTESLGRGAGGLRAKGSATGARFYFRSRDSRGRYDDLPLGLYDEHGRDGLTLAQARQKAGALSLRIQGGVRDLRAVIEAEQRAADRERRAAQAAEEAAQARQQATLALLLVAYADHLKDAGKPSWRQVRRAAERNIGEPFPKIAALPAHEVTVDDVMPVFHRLAKAGKLREAEKLRAYLRAAYTAARKARTDATMHAFADFTIRENPLVDLDVSRPKEAVEKAATAARARKWALSESQLAAYWRRLQVLDSPEGAALRLHLLSGGQRVEQLSRATQADHDSDAKTITLRDTKGRRRVAHEHLVPLLPEAEKALAAMRKTVVDEAGNDVAPGPHLVSLDNGHSPAGYHRVWEALQTVAAAMVEAGEVDRPFTPGTIRKTVETRLAAAGVSKEIRGRLQSHGVSGVQDRFYDAHDYDAEKRAALRKLRALCEPVGEPGNVTTIGSRGMRA